MTHPELNKHKCLSSKLSAEAETFVPGQFNGPRKGGPMQSLGHSQHPGNNMQPLGQLPNYITSCYPFVQGEPDGTTRSAMSWDGSGPPPAPNYTGQRMPPPQAANYSFQGTRPSGPPCYQGSCPIRPQSYIPRHPFPPQGLSQPPVMGQGPPPGGGPQPPFSMLACQQMGIPPPGWMPNGPYPPSYPPPHMTQDHMYQGGQFNPSSESMEWNGSEKYKSSDRKKRKKNENMVSVGIQNEFGLHLGTNTSSKKKPKTKTIICMDVAIQTDFSDEIANLTLADKANALYKRGQSRNWQVQDSTSESEVDSDSGYSSPLHRRNQASNGTHPAALGVTYPPGGCYPMDSQSIPLSKHGTNTYPCLGPGVNLGYNPHVLPVGTLPTNYTTQPYMRGFSPQPRPVSGLSSAHSGSCENISGESTGLVRTSSNCSPVPETEEANPATSTGKKKRRRARRKKKRGPEEEVNALSDEPSELRKALSSSNVSRTSTVDTDILHFEDEEEFPNLLSAVDSGQGSAHAQHGTVMSYSDILKNTSVKPLSGKSSICSSVDSYLNNQSSPESRKNAANKESKTARKRRKRYEQANMAADAELAEITLEQQVLKEFSVSPAPPAPPKQAPVSKKKTKQPMSLNIADMIDALERQKEEENKMKESVTHLPKKKEKAGTVANILDSSAPLKRGKERETPKPKKPSPLKKVILKEREENKRLRLLDESNPLSPGDSTSSSQLVSIPDMAADSDLSQDASSSKTSGMDFGGITPSSADLTQASTDLTPASVDLSPISQTSPISMSPLSGSPLSSGVNSPIAGSNVMGQLRSSVLLKIHSRRFREYCSQILDKDIDSCCTLLLQDLVRFQDKLFHKDPVKAKAKRRIVLGLREVTKHLKMNKIKCVIISPNLERIQSKGGLDEALNNIIDMCSDQEVPFVFALGRRALGRACAKLVPVSVVGIFNFEGSEENFRRLIDLVDKAREEYCDMVADLEKELTDSPTSGTKTSVSGVPQLFPHLGHSRTPSACSAISFTSSILSEPISENYPHSEPETDSRGYEIVKESNTTVKTEAPPAESKEMTKDSAMTESQNGIAVQGGKLTVVESLDDIDEGHEADTEDDRLSVKVRESPSLEVSEREARPSSRGSISETRPSSRGSISDDDSDEHDEDSFHELPHIESIHSSVVDISAEILSQHSSKTLDMSVEVLSTHSSKTLEGGTCGHTPHEIPFHNVASSPDLKEVTSPLTGQKIRSLDKDRIETWVAETQKQIECLNINGPVVCNQDNKLTVHERNGHDRVALEPETKNKINVEGSEARMGDVDKLESSSIGYLAST